MVFERGVQMNRAVEAIMARDGMLSARFDRRVRTAAELLIPLQMAAIVINCAIDGQVEVAAIHGTMAVMAWIILRRMRDMISFFIFSHAFWMFSFMTYLYAFTHWHVVTYGLADPIRSSLVALASQTGLFIASFFAPRFPIYPSYDRLMSDGVGQNSIREGLLLTLGLLGPVSQLLHLLPQGYVSTLIMVLYAGLSLRLISMSSNPFKDPIILGVFIFLVLVGIKANGRSELFSIILLLGFLSLMTLQKIRTIRNALVLYFVWRLLGLFSLAILSVRWARGTGQSLVGLFLSKFMQWDTLVSLLNPFHVPALQVESAQTQPEVIYGFYSQFLGHGMGHGTSILGRLTLLPWMDIVVARLPYVHSIDWEGIWRIFLSALPALGQEKNLILGDQLVWELGLRQIGNIGRPMITAEAEIYSLGGYLFVCVSVGIMFWIFNWWYRQIVPMSGSRVSTILIYSQFFALTIFSTTFLTTLAGTIRGPLQIFIVLAFARFLMLSYLPLTSREGVRSSSRRPQPGA